MRISPELEAFNTALGLVTFMVLVILFASAHNQSKHKEKKSDDILMMATMFLAISTLADVGTWAFLSESAHSGWFNLCIIVDYEFMQMTLVALHIYVARYVSQYISLPKWCEYVALPICAAMGILWSLSIWLGIFYEITPEGCRHTELYIVSQIVPAVVILIDTLLIAACISKLPKRHVLIWSCYEVVIIAAYIIGICVNVPVFYVALAMIILLIFLDIDSQKNIVIQQNREDLAEARAALVLAQIKPHFIYNCLATIHELCKVDSKQAAETTRQFSNFLRGMMESIDKKSMVSFEEEMNIVDNYCYIEKVRFGDKIKVEKNLEVKDFNIPPLTIQPLIENAIKHGLRRKAGGGSVRIHTYAAAQEYIVDISDDGIGFKLELVEMDNENHIGLQNVEMRLNHMCGGNMEIESTPNVGTTIRLHIPRDVQETSREQLGNIQGAVKQHRRNIKASL